MNVLKSEWIKLKSVRSTWISLVLIFAIVVLNVISISGSTPFTFTHRGEFWEFTRLVCAQTIIIVCGVITIIFATNEFDNGTINPSLLATPNRTFYFLAKGLMSSLYMTLVGTACMLLSFILIYIGKNIREHLTFNSFLKEFLYHFMGNFIFSILAFFLIAWIFHGIAMLSRKSTTALSAFFGILIAPLMVAATLGRIKGFIGDFVKFLYNLTPNEIFRNLTNAYGMYKKPPGEGTYIIWWQALLFIIGFAMIINIVSLFAFKKQEI
ncbi:MAG: ABC transporter permease [Lactobacillales bacterium]|jgi:ABC-2 type transport system permease protein|nr:ABC transporter permease [Lactobacillales bacterium]